MTRSRRIPAVRWLRGELVLKTQGKGTAVSHVTTRLMTTTRWLSLAILCASCNLETAPPAGSDTLSQQFDRQEARIPMRDGVELFTVILTPKDEAEPFPSS